jgi:serine/threonine-protein kinase HipA
MALTLYGRANRLTRQHFLDAGERLGVRPRATARMIDSIVDAAPPWCDRCADIGFDTGRRERLSAMLRARLDSLR